jgi:hypothetical protein
LNIRALKDALERANIDERFVSLDGSARDESLVLEHDPVTGWRVYFSERGQRNGERIFRSEDQACQFIFDTLSRDPTVKKTDRDST